MALDRLFTMYPSLAALGGGTGAVAVWGERAVRSSLVGVGDVAAYPTTGLLVEDSTVIRTRWRADITLRNVFVEAGGRVWFPERIAEVGRRAFLDIAASAFEGVTAADQMRLGQWPRFTDPYTAQAGWGLVDSAGDPVQNIVPIRWDSHDDTPFALRYHRPDLTLRAGYWTGRFFAANDGYAGAIARGSGRTNVVTVQGLGGVRGVMWVREARQDGMTTFTVQTGDGEIPVLEPFQVQFEGAADPGMGIGTALRILSTEDLA